jgi:hypothetical protein
MQMGPVEVMATSGRGHSPEALVDLCMRRLMSVSDTAPEPIKAQAIEFQERIRPLLLHYMQQAIRSDRTTLHNQLREAGQHEAAALILKL